MAKKTIKKRNIFPSSKKIFKINRQLTKEIYKRSNKGNSVEKVFKRITNKIDKNSKSSQKTLKRTRSGSSVKGKGSIRSGAVAKKFKKKNKQDKIVYLSNKLSSEIKKVLNGKTKQENTKKLNKLKNDLFILGKGSKTRSGADFTNSVSRFADDLQSGAEDFIGSKTGSSTAGKVVGAAVKAATWVTAIGGGLLVADYVTDELVESFDDCPASGFFDGPHVLTDNGIIYDNLGNW
tara:strand:- start:2258 stop:2962 length:705 start_codon:yes stop_codon:yes gene_type:complete